MTKVHRYYLPRNNKPWGTGYDSWSVWLIDEATGTLCIFGDYGNWSHTWGHSGRSGAGKRDFRYELLDFNSEYLADKLGYGVPNKYDGTKTLESVRRCITSLRRSGELSCEEVREDYDDARQVEDGEPGFADFLNGRDGRWDLYGSECEYTKHRDSWRQHLTTVTFERFKHALHGELFRGRARAWFAKEAA